jgi:hypothetical protein
MYMRRTAAFDAEQSFCRCVRHVTEGGERAYKGLRAKARSPIDTCPSLTAPERHGSALLRRTLLA